MQGLIKNEKIKDNKNKKERNLFRLKKQINDTRIKNIKFFYRLKKEN